MMPSCCYLSAAGGSGRSEHWPHFPSTTTSTSTTLDHTAFFLVSKQISPSLSQPLMLRGTTPPPSSLSDPQVPPPPQHHHHLSLSNPFICHGKVWIGALKASMTALKHWEGCGAHNGWAGAPSAPSHLFLSLLLLKAERVYWNAGWRETSPSSPGKEKKRKKGGVINVWNKIVGVPEAPPPRSGCSIRINRQVTFHYFRLFLTTSCLCNNKRY